MKKIFPFFILALSIIFAPNTAWSGPIYSPTAVANFTAGTSSGMTFIDLSKMKVLNGYGDNSTTNNSGRELGTAAGYQVPVGKTFRILGVGWNTDTAASSVVIGYSDNDVGVNTATVYTNFVGVVGTTSQRRLTMTSSASANNFVNLKFDVPAGKYPAIIYVGGAGNFVGFLYGIEF